MQHSTNTFSLKEFENALLNFGESIAMPAKRALFYREYNFFKNNNLLTKLASAHKIAQTLRKSEIRTGTTCFATNTSFLYYTLNITKSNPLRHELFAEQIIDTQTDFLPIDFFVGKSEKDRLLSILKEVYKAKTILLPPVQKKQPLHMIDCIIEPLLNSAENFHTSAFHDKIVLPDAHAIMNNKFRFFLDPATDIIESTIEEINSYAQTPLNSASIPLDDSATLSNWRLIEDAIHLGMEHYVPQIKALEAFAPNSFDIAMALIAFYYHDCHTNENASILFKNRNQSSPQPKEFSYHCLGLLEETGGLLVYEEQFCHILHFLGNMNYTDALQTLHYLRRNNHTQLEAANRIFLEGAIDKGIPLKKAEQIALYLFNRQNQLVSKRKALEILLPLYQINFLKTNFKQQYKKALAKYSNIE